MSDRGLESWTEDLTARERVRKVATSVTQPRSVEWVRKEAHVSSWDTTKDELEMLVEFDQLQTVEGSDGNSKYAPNYQQRYFSELAELINTHTRAEIRDEIAVIREEIESWKTTYGVDARSDLEATLTDDELPSDEIRDRNAVLREWERHEDTIRLLKHALELYDDARQSAFKSPSSNHTTSSHS